MKQPGNWKDFERHPLSEEYPDIGGRAWEAFVANLRDVGIVNDRKIVLHEGKVIDGWQLYRGCLEAEIKPEFEELKLPKGMAVERWVETVQDHRRHETQEKAVRRADERRQRVVAARVEGESLRAIAEQEGVSEKTVRNDLETAGAEGSAPETVTGKDKKTYPATKPPTLCDRCKRVSPKTGNPGCNACAELRGENTPPAPETNGAPPKDSGGKKTKTFEQRLAGLVKKGKIDAGAAETIKALPAGDRERVIEHVERGFRTKEAIAKAAEEKEDQREQEVATPAADDDGVPIPERALPAFEARAGIRQICRSFDALSREVKGLSESPAVNPAILQGVVGHVQAGKNTLWQNQPSHVCPYCKGRKEECPACHGRGWVNKIVFDNAPKDPT